MRMIEESELYQEFCLLNSPDLFVQEYNVIPELESADCLVIGTASKFRGIEIRDERDDVDILRVLNRLFPELEIAVRVKCKHVITTHFSPKGVVTINPCCRFPVVDWIPEGWNNSTLIP
jgi:hypothetical protein